MLSNVAIVAASLALVLSVVYGVICVMAGPSTSTDVGNSTNSTFPFETSMKLYDELGRYIIEDYDSKPVFSNFLPALAGYYGKPLYSFYVNRGQGIASFGTESKDYPILEFESANKAYQTTPFVGFRTFLQIQPRRRGSGFTVVEPFSVLGTRFSQGSGRDKTNKPKQ